MTITAQSARIQIKRIDIQIRRIDRSVRAINRKMRSLETIDLSSATSWQAAWDKHPDHSGEFMSSVDFLESKAGTAQEKAAAALVILRASNHLFGLPCYERDWCRGDRIAVRLLDAIRAHMGYPDLQNHTKLEASC